MNNDSVKFHVSDDNGCQILYFTTCSCMNHDKGIIYIGGSDENPNIFRKDFETGESHQISENHDGVMKSYVYFNGYENKGIGKASVSFDNIHEKVYYLQGLDICCADLDGHIRVLNRIPEDQVTAFTHISRDGKRFCVPTTDKRALEFPRKEGEPFDYWESPYDIDIRCRKEHLNSYLRVYDTETGEEILCEKVPKCWITHVSFHPVNPDIIMYNHEWCEYSGLRRIWLWNGKYHTAIRSVDEGRDLHDWVCHEMWSDDGRYIYYHGGYIKDGIRFLGRYSMKDRTITEVPFDRHYTGYGHFNNAPNGLFVCDGYYENADDQPEYNGRWISFQKVDWVRKHITWYPAEIHDSAMNHQDNHPHPTFNPEGTRVYYTSTRSGKREIYSVAVPNELC